MGVLVDRLTLRPAIGWAIAWSFDRLRLLIEQGQSPELSILLATVYALARLTVVAVWLWHGLVPKLLFRHPAELVMLHQAGLPSCLNAPKAVNKGGYHKPGLPGCLENEPGRIHRRNSCLAQPASLNPSLQRSKTLVVVLPEGICSVLVAASLSPDMFREFQPSSHRYQNSVKP